MYEFKVIPAPKRGLKAKGVKTHEARFSHALQEVMNQEAADGWEFLRAETLPSEEKSGFRSSTVVYRSVLVFKKPILVESAAAGLEYATAAPVVAAPAPEPETTSVPEVYIDDPESITSKAGALNEPDADYDSSNAKA